MKIDTNLRIQTDTNLNIDKSAIKNLEIDKTSILRPNSPKLPEKSLGDQTVRSKKMPLKPKGPHVNWSKLMKAILSVPNEKKHDKTQELNVPNVSQTSKTFSIPIIRSLGDNIRFCIMNKTKARLYYEGGERIVEIYCWGQNTLNNEVIRVYQIGGYSESDNPTGFKTFLISKIKNFQVLYNERFLAKPGYRKNDEEIKKIYLQL